MFRPILVLLLLLFSTLGVFAEPPATGDRIGLLDMGHVFQNYQGFIDAREKLKSMIEVVDAEASEKALLIQTAAKDLEGLIEGSPDYIVLEEEMTKLAAEFEAFKQNQKRRLVKAEAELYKRIYLEVRRRADALAREEGYTLILRFQRPKPLEAETPQEILKQLNMEIVFSLPERDITDALLERLNAEYMSRRDPSLEADPQP